MTHERNNNQNRHSEGGTTEETSSNYFKVPRYALDDVKRWQKQWNISWEKGTYSFLYHTNRTKKNRHSERGTTEETSSNYFKVPRTITKIVIKKEIQSYFL